MNKKETKQLKPGDSVFWTDPDDGICSREITIKHIEVRPDMVRIDGTDDTSLECLPSELKRLS